DAEVVADEARRIADAVEAWRRQFRIPRVLGKTDVVAEGAKLRAIELDRGIDAVVLPPLWRARVEERSRNGRIGRVRLRKRQPSVVACHRDGPSGSNRAIGLHRVPSTCC